MVVIQLTDALLGLSYTEKDGNFSYTSGFLISQRPIFGVALRNQKLFLKKKKSRICTGKVPILNAIIEKKEFEFKPSFGDYLKTMESIKSTRGNEDMKKTESLSLRNKDDKREVPNGKFREVEEVKDSEYKASDSIKVNTEKKKVEFKSSFDEYLKEMEYIKITRKNRELKKMESLKEGNNVDMSEGQNGKYNEVEEVSVNTSITRNREVRKIDPLSLRNNEVTREGQNGKYGEVFVKGNRETRKIDPLSLRNNEGTREGQNGKYGEVFVKGDFKGNRETRNIDPLSLRNEQDTREGQYGKFKSISGSREMDTSSWRKKEGHNGKFGDIDGVYVKTEERRSMGKIEGQNGKFGEIDEVTGKWYRGNREMRNIRGNEDSDKFNDKYNSVYEKKFENKEYYKRNSFDHIDRVAFKSMEEINDPYDKPRITRADMEDRIQTLAKSLNGADIDIPEWMFSKMMRSAKIRFSDHSILRLIQLFGKLNNWKRVLQVIEWIQSGERFKSHRLKYIYTAALDVLKKSKRPVEALNLFQTMKKQTSSYPDIVAYHSIAVTLGQAGYMKELFYVIDSMRNPPQKKFKPSIAAWDPRLEPDIIVYNAVLNACVHRKNWEGAFWVLQQLKEQNHKPSSSTYGLVMEVMYVCGKYDLVHDFFRRVQKSCIPNALTYKVLVNTFWKEGKIEEAILAVKEMEKRGIIGTASLYYDLARCLVSAGKCQEGLKQIDKICRVASKPLVVTYTGLIQACLDANDMKSAKYIFSEMYKFCSPNLITYNIMVKGYLDHEMFDEAKELFSSLLLSKDKVGPDIYTFNTMLDGFAREKKWDDIEFTYIQMLKRGFPFNAKRHLKVVLDTYNAGKWEVLEATWKHLVQANRVAPPMIVRAMFCKKVMEGDYCDAILCISEYPFEDSQVFSRKSWLSFFMGDEHRLEKDMVNALLKYIVDKNDSRNLAIRNLMISCREFLRT